MKQISLYIHIPFCRQICQYCDFATSRFHKSEEIDRYVGALVKEIETRLPELAPLTLPSLYFGGGTPSLLGPEQMIRIFSSLKKYATFEDGAEITLEANPDLFERSLLEAWREYGINRISLGAQSFNAKTLAKLGRLHTPEDIQKSFETLKNFGFENISLDLIYGLPSETIDDFENSLTEAVRLDSSHVSLYQLAVEEKTPFFVLKQRDRLALPPEEETAGMYEAAVFALENAGFRHYELQNFAKPGFESVHNLRYWHHEEFIGLGVGAYSYVNGKRFGHGKVLKQYLDKTERGDFSPETSEVITPEIRLKEKIILGLRLMEGIDLDQFTSEGFLIPQEMTKKLNRLTREEFLRKNKNTYRLSLRGEHLSEWVATQLV